jgi:glycosyltransferase involved in cell wall biosynthesis
MAAGVPVVATDACGTRECISDGLTGRVVARRDPGALAHGVIDTLRDPAAARVRTIAARRRYEEAFTAERMAEDVEVLYEELLEHSPRRPLLEKGTPPLAAVR